MEPALAIHEFLEYVVVGLISRPEDARITRTVEDGGRLLYRVALHPDDVGRVVGKSGKTISSIRSLVHASAQKHHIDAEVEVVDI